MFIYILYIQKISIDLSVKCDIICAYKVDESLKGGRGNMYSKRVVIVSELGLYGKVATMLIQIANKYMSTIFIECEGKKANAKSLLGVLSFALTKGKEITVSATGIDEKEAVDDIVMFIESGSSSVDYASEDDEVIKDQNARKALHNETQDM